MKAKGLSDGATDDAPVSHRARELFVEAQQRVYQRTDFMFAWLMLAQWLGAIVAAAWISPKTWIGVADKVHWHVWAALFLGGTISGLPVFLAFRHPGRVLTRHTIAFGQMVMSALLIHLTGGRIETHFHIFGSLAFLAFYRDWRVLVTATLVVTADHMLRGLFWPQSVFGVLTTNSWRWLEHAGWVLFEDAFLFLSIRQSLEAMFEAATHRARLEGMNAEVESLVEQRTTELMVANASLQLREERFRKLSAAAPVGIFETDAAGQCLYTNSHWQNIAGLSLAESLGQGWRQAIHPADVARLDAAWNKCLQEGAELDGEFRFRRPSGEERWVQVRGTAVHSHTGSISGHVGTVEDITEQRRAGELLRLQEAALRSAANVVVITDRQGLIVWTNPAFTRVTGFSAAEVQGKNPRVLKYGADAGMYPPDYYQSLWRTISTGQVWHGEFHNQRKDGTPLYEEATITPVRDDRGEITHFVAVKQDITARKAAEAELKHAHKELVASEERFFSAFENASIGMALVSPAGQWIKVNRALCQLTGYAPDELLHTTFQDITHPDDLKADLANVQQLLAGQIESYQMEKRYFHKQGGIVWVLLSVSLVRDEQGQPVHFVSQIQDISARRQAETDLDFERQLLQALLETSHDYVYFKDRESRFLRCSRVLAARLGAEHPAAIIGKTDFDYFVEEHARPAFEDEQGIIRTGQPVIDKMEFEKTKDGRVSWALTSKMPLRDARGEIIGTFGISKDITAIKEAEAKLEQAHKQLLATSRQAGMAEVATTVLHNVGNVLNSINVSATLVTEGLRKSKVASLPRVVALVDEHAAELGTFLTQDPKGKQLPAYLRQLSQHLVQEQTELVAELDGLGRNVEHIKKIIAVQQDLARFSGLIETVSLTEVVEDALRLSDTSLQRHGVTVCREFAELPPIAADRHKILQILVNLIRNAKHACEAANRDDRQLIIRTEREAERMKISVTDNGVGIPPENLDRIFNHGFTTKKDGHGFGLHSGANAAKEMGGALRVHSPGVGLGATFTLELPCQPEPDRT